MPNRPVDKCGKVFGRLTVIADHGKIKGRRHWKCVCACGTLRIVDGGNLSSGNTQSCGCWQREITGESNSTHGHKRGGRSSAIYTIWCSMVSRCTNPNADHYLDYGGRGITVCKRWRKFENFLADMGERPSGLSIERRHNDKGYSRANCYWATRTEQNNNKRNNVRIRYKGEVKSLAQWADSLGFSRSTLYHRYERGWGADRMLTQRQRRRL